MPLFFSKLDVVAAIALSIFPISSPSSKEYDIVDLTPVHGEATKFSESSTTIGQILYIKLQSNVGTASNWQCVSVDKNIVDIKDLGTEREVPVNDGMVGYRQSRKFAIIALNYGITTVGCDLLSYNGQSYLSSNIIVNIR